MLGRSVKALADAEAANQSLLRLGLQAADAYARATPEASRSRDNPLGGFAAVRLEDQAEALRREMAALQLKP